MKNILLTLSFILFGVFAQAQKGTTTFSLGYGKGKGQIKPLMAKAQMLGAHSEGDVRTFDVSLVGAVSKSTAIEIGLSLLNHRYQYRKFDFPVSNVLEDKSVYTLIFPIKVRFDILKYFFISGGFLLINDFDRGRQTDLGVSIGAGVQYYFKNKYGVFIYPQTNVHTLTIGLLENHTSFGIAYRIPNPK